MKELLNPTADFNMQPSTYAEVTKVIMKMKSSVSLCPLVLPYVRVWQIDPGSLNCKDISWRVESQSGVTILAYKKGDAGNPDNFRLITLQPVLSKVFTSIIWNRLFTFASKNKYIEKNLQKGFWEKISGCIEHIECLSHIINNAKSLLC